MTTTNHTMKYKDIHKYLGTLIKTARLEAGLTQTEVAEALGTYQPNISRAEKEGCVLSFACKIFEVCGFEITDLQLHAKDMFREGLWGKTVNCSSYNRSFN